MTRLRVFAEDSPEAPLATHTDPDTVAAGLAAIGVRFERWDTRPEVRAGDQPERVLDAYQADIDRIMAAGGYRSADVVSMHPEHPERAAMRRKFLEEHTHAEDEVRFFVDGEGLFTLHARGQVFEVLCQRGDLIGVPAGTAHWFDMGPNPSFCAVRIFTSPDGWAADFTGDDIAARFPRLEN